MGFGDLISSGNIGSEFAKALTVKVPKSKYGLIEGLAMAQKKKAAAAKAGLSAEDDINKLRIKAAEGLDDVDPKVRDQMQEALYNFMDNTDKAILSASDPSAAMPSVTRAYMQFKDLQSDISSRSAILKKLRSQAAQPNVLVPPTVTEFLDNKEASVADDGLIHLAGWRDRIKTNDQLGWASMTFPRKMVLGRYDQALLENNDVGFFEANSDGAPTVETKKIEGRTIETTKYKLSKDAIRRQVLASATDLDYLANLSYSYYEKNRKDPNFRQRILDLEVNNPTRDILFEEAINNRVDELYNVGIYKTDEVSGSKPTSVNVRVGDDDKSRPSMGTPFVSQTKIKQTMQDRSKRDASVYTMGSTISSSGPSNLSVVEGTIDVNSNEEFKGTGTFDFTPSQIVIAPVYKDATRAERAADVQGKLVDSGALSGEYARDNVRFDIFVQGTSSKEFSYTDGTSSKGAELFYPAQNFWASNQAASTKAQISVGEAELKTMAELSAVRDLLNDKVPEAVTMYKELLSSQNPDTQARLIALAYSKGYVDPYRKGQSFKPPQEMGQKAPGPGIQTNKPKPAAKPAEKPAAKPAEKPATGLPKGESRRTAKRESL